MTKEQIEEVFNLLFTGAFDNWYKGDFEAFVTGDDGAPSKEKIVEWLSTRLGGK